MKRLLLTIICCSPLVLSSAGSFAADAAEAVSAEHTAYQQYGPIRYYESLWSISSKLRPNRSVSVHQTLVAIYKLNPNVFINGDINHLIKNSFIKVPTNQFIKLQTEHEAFVLITKYSNLKREQVAKKATVDDSIATPSESAEQKNPAAGVLIEQASPEGDPGLDAGVIASNTPSNIPGNVPVSETVQSSSVNDPTSSANAQPFDNQSLQAPDDASSSAVITPLNQEILQAKPENDALIAADMQVSTTGSNANNETLTETASTDNSGNVMPVQLAVM
ncbi:MAG: FimV/HubP family polar landmark protein, partial [Psychromonas sp.]